MAEYAILCNFGGKISESSRDAQMILRRMTTLNLPKYIFRTKTEDGKHFIYDDWRKRYVSLTPEEWVRQHFARFLVQEKGFPAGRMGNEISLVQNGRKRRCDTVVYDKTGRPFVIVEYKAPHVEITQTVFDQIVRYNSVLQVRYLIISNGITNYCCEVDYTKHKCIFLKEIPFYTELRQTPP